MAVINPPSPISFGPNNQPINYTTGVLTTSNGPKNYVSYNNFENNTTTGWSLGTVGTLTNGIPTGVPTFGSGASGNLSIVTTASNILSGTASLSLISSAATTPGNMLATQVYTLDPEDQAKVLTFKFYYNVPSGVANTNFSGTNSNSFGIAIWDATNSVWLSSTANFGMTQTSGSGYVTGTCQTGSTTASVQLVIYAANATAGAATLNFDDFFLGPQTAPIGAPITDWVAYTPTFAGLGTPSLVSFFSRRVGGNLEVVGTLTTGTVTGATVTISLGFQGGNNNVTVDTTRVSGLAICGQVGLAAASTTLFGYFVLTPSTNQTFVNLALQSNTVGNTVTITGSSVGSSTLSNYKFSVPIVGWQSNVQMSNDTDTRVISWNGSQTSQAVTANVTDITFTTINDRTGSWSTNAFTIPVSGDYVVTGSAILSSSGSLQVYRSGSIYNNGFFASAGVAAASGGSILVTGCTAGQTLSVRSNASVTVTSGNLGIYRLSGPSVIAATESVNMSYNTSSTALSGSLATVTYSNKIRDSHNQYASGSYTIPVTGTYSAAAAIAVSGTIALNNTLDLQIQQTGSATQIAEQKVYSGGVETALSALASDLFYCLAGDVLKVQVSSSVTGPTIVSSASQNYFSIARVGN